jgi:hypothetical protein
MLLKKGVAHLFAFGARVGRTRIAVAVELRHEDAVFAVVVAL